MAGEIRNKFVSWTLNVVKEIKEIPVPLSPKRGGGGDGGGVYGVGVNLALVRHPSSSSSSSSDCGDCGDDLDHRHRQQRVGVDTVDPNGPAARAGLVAGDVVLEVDGRRFDDGGASPDDVAGAIRGPEGSEVGVVVERRRQRGREGEEDEDGDGGGPKRLEFTLTREPIGRREAVRSPPSSPAKEKKKKQTKQEEKERRSGDDGGEGAGRTEKERVGEDASGKEQKKSEGEGTFESKRAAPSSDPPVGSEFPAPPNAEHSENGDTNSAGKESKAGPESKKAAPSPARNLLDSLDSPSPSEEVEEEEHKENGDVLASSSAEDAESHHPRHCCALLDVPYVCAARSRDFIDEVPEEKTAVHDDDEDDDDAPCDSASFGDDSQWELISERSSFVVSFSGGGSSFRSASPSAVLENKFVLAEYSAATAGGIMDEHVVLPSDTLQGLCLAYELSATRLRMENGFSGNSLRMAPKKLRIPRNNSNSNSNGESSRSESKSSSGGTATTTTMVRTQDRTSAEYKLYAFVAELPSMELVEARAYLDLSNWDLDEALRSAREDEGWNGICGFEGSSSSGTAAGGGPVACHGTEAAPRLDAVRKPKALTARDVYAAPPPYEGDGFELKDITPSAKNGERQRVIH